MRWEAHTNNIISRGLILEQISASNLWGYLFISAKSVRDWEKLLEVFIIQEEDVNEYIWYPHYDPKWKV